MFQDKVDRQDFAKMDPEYQDLLGRVLTVQADCEIGGPHLYVDDMLPGAPTKVDQLIVARTAAEEIDHYRKIARVAGEIGVDVSAVLSARNQDRYLEAFRGVIKTWEDYAVFGFLVDRVGFYQLDEFKDCTYTPLPQILPEIVKEELGHIGFGTNRTAELAEKGGAEKEKAQRALDFWYPKALDMFGHSVSERSDRYVHWGIKRRTNAQAREEYIREVEPLIAQMGLRVPDPMKDRHFV